eukprot:TRINITY_DN2229_c0_g2_i13.p1 TRINITY_DN2229_c0_g2~~TRINITY_DN2229_c0_g2_i13.p1  ORF type:complete len:212 (-),score=49.33 TRINITY_DN2229_c0_g2_i13:105-740(-)
MKLHFSDLSSGTGHDKEQSELPSELCQYFSVKKVLEGVLSDVRGISVTVHGISPCIKVSQNSEYWIIGPPSYFYFILMELLKNSVNGMVKRYGLLDLDSAIPIQVNVQECKNNDHMLEISIVDLGCGIPSSLITKMGDFFGSTQKWRENPSYTYSGEFGVPIGGLGCGFVLSKIYAQPFGGSLVVSSTVDVRTEVKFTIDKFGNGIIDPME